MWKRLKLEATVNRIGHAWYDPTQVANIFGLSYLKEKHGINYESDKEYAFLVHTKPGMTKLKATPEVLYDFKPPTRYLNDSDKNNNMIP